MKVKNVIYMVLMVVFIVLAYLFFDLGSHVKTKVDVTYQEKSDIAYQVYLHENDIYDKQYLGMDERYISKLVDYINIDFTYESLFNRNLNGFYTYKVINTLVGYTDDINESLFKKEKEVLKKTVTLNQNDLKEIKISDNVKIDYDEYSEELKKYNQEYNTNISGYVEVKILVNENIDLFGKDKVIKDEKEMKLIIPLSYDTFKISVLNDNNNKKKYYDFSHRELLNYIFYIISILCLSAGISFIVLTIRNMIKESYDEIDYRRRLRKIISEHSNKLVSVKEFYSKHKYNLIYVTSFAELLDAYRRVQSPISYKEVKKNAETIFLMIDEDSAWIYRLTKDK